MTERNELKVVETDDIKEGGVETRDLKCAIPLTEQQRETVIRTLQFLQSAHISAYKRAMSCLPTWLCLEALRVRSAQSATSMTPEVFATGCSQLEDVLECDAKYDLPIQVRNKIKEVVTSDVIAALKAGKNVRAAVKSIWMMINNGAFIPFVSLSDTTSASVLTKANRILADIRVVPFKEAGKLYLDVRGLREIVFKQLKADDLIPEGFVLNIESSHVTILNSNVVALLDQNVLVTFMKEWQAGISLRAINVQLGHSDDWPMFSGCLVIGFDFATGSELRVFAEALNKAVGQEIVPSKFSAHTTIAVLARAMNG